MHCRDKNANEIALKIYIEKKNLLRKMYCMYFLQKSLGVINTNKL